MINMIKRNSFRTHFIQLGTRSLAATAILSRGILTNVVEARPVPQNVAGGLGALVESHVAIKAGQTTGLFNGYATEEAANYASLAIQDTETGRFLVDIYPKNDRVKAEVLAAILQQRFSSFTLTALDKNYKGVGVVEGFIS